MRSATIYMALAFSSSLANAHGKPTTATLAASPEGWAFYRKAVCPTRLTEVDTPVFNNREIASKGLGTTTGGGKIRLADAANSIQDAGDDPAKITKGGKITLTWRTVTSDGGGPIRALCNTEAKDDFTQNSIELAIDENVPGKGGNVRPGPNASRKLPADFAAKNAVNKGAKNNAAAGINTLFSRFIGKRAVNVNDITTVVATAPENMACNGVIGNHTQMCLCKFANNNAAGPFGAAMPIKMVSSTGNSTTDASVGGASAGDDAIGGKSAAANKKAGNSAAAKFES